MTKITAAITAIGMYVPDDILTNEMLEKMVDTNDEWITSRTGIKERRILKGEGKGTSFMAIKAAQELIEKRKLDPKEIELVVWYTESIPVSVGPDAYAGLPGAILEVDSDNGGNVITATEFTAKYAAKELKQPTKGDKMNRAQFAESMKKIMEDMQRGGGMGGMRIRMNQ